ncbi:MAG: pyruvate:ferredoxin (flavodoxin) oxidoreductase [Planctomycetota bacterium]|jgi:pyruvate-ferredoxin/flavodoxin oxidoreductase
MTVTKTRTATTTTIDANEATTSVAYRLSEVAAIYPISPSSPMGEEADAWAAQGRTNIWGQRLNVVEMQSEGGAAGAVHGAIQGGALATTFTASQGLLLMLPNMYKIAGELTPFVMHVAARTIATHALSIFGDHSDVMACRQTGFAMLASSCAQEAHDMACVAHVATLESRIPFLHFFDGFRSSHEISTVSMLSDDDLRAVINDDALTAHRKRALTPDHPVVRGTAHNPDTYFQAREAINPYYDACPEIIRDAMNRLFERTGRQYNLFDYFGHPEAERVMVLMGSAVETARETVDRLNAQGEKVGVVAVRCFRPWSGKDLIASLPGTTKAIAIMDRTKEPGATADPLFHEVMTTLMETDGRAIPRMVGGRYGLSGKEFTPAMIKAVFDEIAKDDPRRRFTVGIVDDVTGHSLAVDESFTTDDDPDVVRAMFFGLGSDGTVGANKNSIKILGALPNHTAQGYFVYDSKKAGAITVSHLRFGTKPIRSVYLIDKASFVACHNFTFLEKLHVLDRAADGATFLLNSPYPADKVWDRLPREVQEQIVGKKLSFYVIDAAPVAREVGLKGRINTIMQTCFFALSGVIPRDEAIAQIKEYVQKTYASKGKKVVESNFAAIDSALEHLHEVEVPDRVTADHSRPPVVPAEAPEFVQQVTSVMLEGLGDRLPVSSFPVDGTWLSGTTKWEKRNIAEEIPIWDPELCIQCNKCAFVCPHAAIRAKVYEPEALAGAPEAFQSDDYRAKDFPNAKYTIQVAPEDCTGCSLCVHVCPAKSKTEDGWKAINMTPQHPLREREVNNYSFFLDLPDPDREQIGRMDVKGTQFLEPLFEYSSACAGCGETPYLKLLSQLYGDRVLVANATGCSSIYGGNLPTTPWGVNDEGRGPAWANSLFEDNAEFGLGARLALDSLTDRARSRLTAIAPRVGDDLVTAILEAPQHGDEAIRLQRERVEVLNTKLKDLDSPEANDLKFLVNYLVRKSVWIVGGDGWAYDIGYGGLDHILSMTHDLNVLVLDTEVYSNTGGQASKATPIGAAAKFAVNGKAVEKKDLGLMAINYGHVYVASIAFGAKDTQTVQAFRDADEYEGPSLIIAHSPCVAHGYDLAYGAEHQKLAVDSGYWPLYRYDPRRVDEGKPPLVMDSKGNKRQVHEFMDTERRFQEVRRANPEAFKLYAEESQRAAERRMALYQHMAQLRLPTRDEA